MFSNFPMLVASYISLLFLFDNLMIIAQLKALHCVCTVLMQRLDHFLVLM